MNKTAFPGVNCAAQPGYIPSAYSSRALLDACSKILEQMANSKKRLTFGPVGAPGVDESAGLPHQFEGTVGM